MPIDLAALRRAVSANQYAFSEHALQRGSERAIHKPEIEEALLNAEVIEDYPEDKRGASCLLLGRSSSGRALHIQVGYAYPVFRIITFYEPEPEKWETDLKTRKAK